MTHKIKFNKEIVSFLFDVCCLGVTFVIDNEMTQPLHSLSGDCLKRVRRHR